MRLNNYSILPEQYFSLDYAPLVVNIQIIKEFTPDVQYIIKNSEEEINFTSDIIKCFKEIDTIYLMNKESLENIVQDLTRKQDHLWYKHLKRVNIVQWSKDW